MMNYNEVLSYRELAIIKVRYAALSDFDFMKIFMEIDIIPNADKIFLMNSKNDTGYLLSEVDRLRKIAIKEQASRISNDRDLNYIKLDEIKSRCERATDGPWTSYVEGRDIFTGSSFIETGRWQNEYGNVELFQLTPDDLDFFAESRTYIPLLLGEIRRLR